MKKRIYPSLIAANVLNLEKTINQLDPYCAGYHIDIMDNHFVPNLTWGPMVANAISTITNKPIDVHFMVDNPDNLISSLIIPCNSCIYIHIELKDKTKRAMSLVKEKNLRIGLAISPKTPINELFRFLDLDIKSILIMSVEPGFSGKSFIPDVANKIKELASYRAQHGLTFTLAIDGGINENNINEIATLGITDFVVGSGIFGKDDPVKAIKDLV